MADNFEKFSDPDRLPNAVQVSEEKPKKGRISPVAISRIVAILLAGLISGLLVREVHRIQVLEKQSTRLSELSLQRAQLTAQNVEVYLQTISRAIGQFASKPILETALRKNDAAQLEDFSSLLRSQLEHVESVRFFQPGKAVLNDKIFPPVRFSELELIRFAENRKPARVEALIQGEERLITIVVPVPATETAPVAGTMMVSLSVDGLSAALEQNNIGMGHVELTQYFGKGRPTLVAHYRGDTVGGSSEYKVAGTPWDVKFSPSFRLSEQARVNIPFILFGLAVLSLVLMAAALWLGSRVGEKVVKVRESGAKGAWGTITAVTAKVADEELSTLQSRKTNILDVDITRGDEQLLGLEEEKKASKHKSSTNKSKEEPAVADISIPDVVFRAYDIRGKYGSQINEDFALRLGAALGSEALDAGEDTLLVARDARTHSPKLTEYLIRGILNSGCHVVNIGTVPTPLMYFATETLEQSSSGVMVTASHNPADQNGFKVVMDGKCRSEQDIKSIRSRMLSNNVYQGAGEESRIDITPSYIDAIFSDVALAGDVSIVIDAANAVAGLVAPRLFEELGCRVTPLFCDLDGKFPNHEPDPTVEKNLQPLIEKVKEMNADLGVALDGDGDRIVVVTSSGKIIWPDRLLMLFAKDIVSRNPGADVVFDVKSTRHLNNCISEVGGRPIMWKTGHSPMKAKMAETGALVGGEYSGHIFIKDRWYGFDDGLYAAARLIEILSLQGQTLDELFAEFPESPATPEIRVEVPEEKKFEIVKALIEKGEFGGGKITTIDGIRVDYSNGWGLVRASNTSAHLTLRFEADDDNALHQLKSLFVKELKIIDSSLSFDWNS